MLHCSACAVLCRGVSVVVSHCGVLYCVVLRCVVLCCVVLCCVVLFCVVLCCVVLCCVVLCCVVLCCVVLCCVVLCCVVLCCVVLCCVVLCCVVFFCCVVRLHLQSYGPMLQEDWQPDGEKAFRKCTGPTYAGGPQQLKRYPGRSTDADIPWTRLSSKLGEGGGVCRARATFEQMLLVIGQWALGLKIVLARSQRANGPPDTRIS